MAPARAQPSASRSRTRGLPLALVGATALVAVDARAEAPTASPMPQAADTRKRPLGNALPVLSTTTPEARPSTLFYGGLGMIALPAAKVCSSPSSPCQPGETSLAFSLSSLVRWRRIAVGAGTDVAIGLRPEQGVRAPGRQHVRSYFTFDALFRYDIPVTRRLEWWVGGSIGAVVLSDSWSTEYDRNPYSDIRTVGPQRLTLRSEGLSLGPTLGGHFRFHDRWLVGSQLRYLNWFLPTERARTPFGDGASLAGRIDVFEFGVFLGFRAGL